MVHGAVAGVKATAEDKNVDQFELGVSMGLGESGKIAFAYKDHDAGTWDAVTASYSGPDPTDSVKIKSTWIAGEYAIGAMTAYVGVGRTKIEDSSKVGTGIAWKDGRNLTKDF